MELPPELIEKRKLFEDQAWRLNNLYKIKDKNGQVVDFVMNDAQEELYFDHWYLNLILKARQLGFTTFIDILILDTCLFNPNVKAGIIAHHQDDAKAIFDEKIKFPYDNLPAWIRAGVRATTDRAGELKFSNGSTIRVSTSFRSGTLQILHVSEYGKISAKYPEKAKEIRSGAFEAVGLGQKIFVESTAEGREGEFYSLVEIAKALKDAGRTLSQLDFKLFFFAWHENPDYRMDPSGVLFTKEDLKYFADLELRGIKLDKEQQAWWIKKHERLQEEMFREHPSYPEEAFKASVEGAYYGRVIAEMRRQGRIAKVPWEPRFPVFTCWDLGMNDSMSIWFFQQISREIRIIDHLQDSGKGLPFYAKELNKKGYAYHTHYMPHDISVRELGTGSKRIDVARRLGIKPIVTVPRPKNNDQLLDQIEDVRSFLRTCWIDEENCDKAIKSLENYRQEWDEKLGTFKNTPLHNWASHDADGIRTGAVGFKGVLQLGNSDIMPETVPDY